MERRTAMLALVTGVGQLATGTTMTTGNVWAPTKSGALIIDIGQWSEWIVAYEGEQIKVRPKEIFDALASSKPAERGVR